MDPWLQVLISVAVALISSNGLWVYFSKKSDKNDATTKLMLGLAHNQIIEQGYAVSRPWIRHQGRV